MEEGQSGPTIQKRRLERRHELLISVLPILSKLVERHVYNHLYAYLTYKLLLYPLDEKAGFRENRSRESILLKLTDYFLNNIDIGKLSDMVLVDLRKVFDLVDHELF